MQANRGICKTGTCKGICTADQEAWIKSRLHTLLSICRDLEASRKVGADELIIDGAIEGAVNGTAIEIIRIFDLEPNYENLRIPGI